MRPSIYLAVVLLCFAILEGFLSLQDAGLRRTLVGNEMKQRITVAALGLTDLCVATEARYTRNPAVSDPVAPVMDHPGAIEHFPSGSFWAPIPYSRIGGSNFLP